MVGFIVGLYVVGWGVFILAILPQHSKLLGIGVAVTAYTLGLRHAFDADHISAIDNTTRKLMSEGKRPLSVGFWFSLGHSSVVFALGIGLTFAARAIIGQVSDANSTVATFGGIIGTARVGHVPLPDRHPQPDHPRGDREGLSARCAGAATTTRSSSSSSMPAG